MSVVANKERIHEEEILLKAKSGMAVLFANLLLLLAGCGAFAYGIVLSVRENNPEVVFGAALAVAGGLAGFAISPILFAGLKVVKPNTALVLTLFGRYYGTLKTEGFYFVNPFVTAVNPAASTTETATGTMKKQPEIVKTSFSRPVNRAISLKAMTLSNDQQKINDQMGNPIIIGIVVVWRVVNTAKAVFNVDNYKEFLSIQCDSALRNIVRLYPYDTAGTDNEKSLRGSSQEIAERLKAEIQLKVETAGLEVLEARITHLSYAQEIAAAMLQRQQASAIIDARQMIVEGAVGMVEMALKKLGENNICALDDERKAAMVSNLLVVLCGNKDAQPIVNSGSLY